jgi:hypothetical protein
MAQHVWRSVKAVSKQQIKDIIIISNGAIGELTENQVSERRDG